MLEVAYILVALALIVFLVYLIITVQKLGRVIDETEKTIKTLTSDVDVTLHHTNELLAKVNVLADDINVKVATIDPLFSAVADLSLSVSDLNDHATETIPNQVESSNMTSSEALPFSSKNQNQGKSK